MTFMHCIPNSHRVFGTSLLLLASGCTVDDGWSGPDAGGALGSAEAGVGGDSSASASGDSTNGSLGCPGADAAEFSLVQSWLKDTTAIGALPDYAYSNIGKNFASGAAFDMLACSIAMACVEFAPSEADWLRKCEAVLTSAIVAESSYNPNLVVMDSHSSRSVNGMTANDPTVGLLQVRFSSTVRDYNYHAPLEKIAAIGCSWPSELATQADDATFWATQGGTTYLGFMQQVPCNIGLAAWYYLYNATGNGGPSATWISQYCSSQGTAGTMVVGLLSHLMGGNYSRTAAGNDGTHTYPWGIECCACGNPANEPCKSQCTASGCTGRFAALMGIGTSSARPSPDPFQEALSPEPTKYCR
jgi:hypothetical protein